MYVNHGLFWRRTRTIPPVCKGHEIPHYSCFDVLQGYSETIFLLATRWFTLSTPNPLLVSKCLPRYPVVAWMISYYWTAEDGDIARYCSRLYVVVTLRAYKAEKVRRSISGLESVLNLNMRIPNPILTLSPHPWHRNNRHQLGNLTEKKQISKRLPRDRTQKREISVILGFDGGFPLILTTKDPKRLPTVFLILVVKRSDRPQTWRLGRYWCSKGRTELLKIFATCTTFLVGCSLSNN